MPSKDDFHAKNPEVNRSFREMGINVGAGAAVPKRQPRITRKMAPAIIRLAERLGVSPDKLAEKYDEDTIRRLQYPVKEREEGDGSHSFEHDLGIEDRAHSTRRTF